MSNYLTQRSPKTIGSLVVQWVNDEPLGFFIHYINKCKISSIVNSINIQIFTLTSFSLSHLVYKLIYKRVHFNTSNLVTKMVIILQTIYQNGFFLNDFLKYNFAIQEFYFLNMIYILLYTDLISSILFQHLNISTRALHHWCLASSIVLVWYCNTLF